MGLWKARTKDYVTTKPLPDTVPTAHWEALRNTVIELREAEQTHNLQGKVGSSNGVKLLDRVLREINDIEYDLRGR